MSGFERLATVFLDADTINPEELDLGCLEQKAAPLRLYGSTSHDQLLARTEGAQCVITNKVKLDRLFFERQPQVRLVCIIATGTNNVDLEAAKAHGVAVVNCRGYSTDSVAQHSLLLMLMLLRSSHSYQRQMDQGRWSQSELFCLLNAPIQETAGLTLGIVGYGEIGQKVHQLADAFGMKVLVSERIGCVPRPERSPFSEVVEQSDIITLHCPLTDQTQGLMGSEVLSTMKPGAFLINTARGGLIDELALAKSLSSGQLGGAALDVLSEEPPSPHHPLLAPALPNLILTPHNAWASRRARQRAVEQTAENIGGWLAGRSLRRVV